MNSFRVFLLVPVRNQLFLHYSNSNGPDTGFNIWTVERSFFRWSAIHSNSYGLGTSSNVSTSSFVSRSLFFLLTVDGSSSKAVIEVLSDG